MKLILAVCLMLTISLAISGHVVATQDETGRLPIVNFDAQPRIMSGTDKVLLSWEVKNADNMYLRMYDDFGIDVTIPWPYPFEGTEREDVVPSEPLPYTCYLQMIASNENGTIKKQVSITKVESNVDAPIIHLFNVQPHTVYPTDTLTLWWDLSSPWNEPRNTYLRIYDDYGVDITLPSNNIWKMNLMPEQYFSEYPCILHFQLIVETPDWMVDSSVIDVDVLEPISDDTDDNDDDGDGVVKDDNGDAPAAGGGIDTLPLIVFGVAIAIVIVLYFLMGQGKLKIKKKKGKKK